MTVTEIGINYANPPEKTRTYTPIPHKRIIKEIEDVCENKNIGIIDRSYQTDKHFSKVTGKYTLSLKDDEMGCMIAFQNSYDKSMSAKFAIGASVFICSNGMVSGDYSIKRKHTGENDNDIIQYIGDAIDQSLNSFESNLILRDEMKTIDLSQNAIHELIGELFFQEEVLRANQLSLIKNEYNNPTHDYGVGKNNLWNVYNLCTDAIERRSHPTLYLNQNQTVTNHVRNKFLNPVIEIN